MSLFAPTHRFGGDVQTDPIRWKNLLTALEPALAQQGLRAPEIADLLAPAWALHEDARAWHYMSDGLAFFIRPGWSRMFRVPADVPEVAAVGDRFVVGPLVRIVAGDAHFLLLALSRRRVRLLEGSLQRVEELELADVPTSLREIAEPAESRSSTMAFSTSPSGRAGPAVFYGHGAADDDYKKEETRAFLRQVADGLHDYLSDQRLPLVLVGLEQLVSIYGEVNAYPYLTDVAIRQNPDQLSAEELHAATWPAVEEILGRQRDEAVDRFGQLHGTGRSSNDPAEIEEAARHGRVEELLLSIEPWCWDRAAAGGAIVRLGADDAFSRCELLDRAAAETLARRGRVFTMAASQVPGGGDVAAVFRY